MKSTVVITLLVVCVVGVLSQAPPKPVWPKKFTVPFGMYNVFPPIKNVSSVLYYDWTVQSQVIDYMEQCVPFPRWNAWQYPCKLYFNPQGIYFNQPATGVDCCKLIDGVGSVPPEFLRGFNYTTVEPALDMWGKPHHTDRWDGAGGFAYWTEVGTGFDIAFKDGDTGVSWNFGVLVPGAPSMNVSLPDNPNCQQSCSPIATEMKTHLQGLYARFAGIF